MFEAYGVSVSLKLNNLVSAQLLEVSKQFERLDVLSLAVTENLKKINLEAKGIGSIAREANSSARAMEKASIAAGNLASRMAAIRAAGSMSAMPSLGGGMGGGGGRSGAGNKSHGPFHGGNVHVGTHGVGLGSVGMATGDAFGPLLASAAIAYAGHGLFEAAKEYQTGFMRFQALNLGDKVNSEADKFAKSARVFGVSATELMKTTSEVTGILGGDFSEAKKFAPELASLGTANAAIFNGKIGNLDEAGLKGLVKFIDRRGGMKDDKSRHAAMDLAEKLVTGSGGFIGFGDLGTFSQQAGTAFRGLSDEGVLGMAGLIQEQGGARAGTALMSIYQNLVAGRTPKKTMALLEEMGLGKIKEVTSGSVGGKKSTSSTFDMNKQYAAVLQADPRRFFNEVWVPLLAKKGISDEAGILKATNDLLSNRTASGQASIFTTQSLQTFRDYNVTKNAMGSDQVRGMFGKSAAGQEAEFGAAWDSFKAVFGTTILPQLTNLLILGSSALRSMAAMGPGTFKAIGAGLALVAVGLGLKGGGMLLSAAFNGLGGSLAMRAVGGVVGINNLAKATTAFGMAAKSAGLLLAAGIAGFEFGKHVVAPLLDKAIQAGTGGKALSLGDRIYQMTHKDTAEETLRTPIKSVAPSKADSGNSKPAQLVLRDGGRPLAEVISGVTATGLLRTPSSNSFDLSMAQPSVSMKTN
jgi:hypothetical protein